MGDDTARIRRFGPFELDLEQRLLLRAGESVPLTPKAFETLAVLVERQGKIVDKGELLKLVWPDTFVEENNLTQNISTLRKAFGGHSYIETIPRRGYRFLAEVADIPVMEPRPSAGEMLSRSGFHWGRIWAPVAIIAVVCVGSYAVYRARGPERLNYRVDSLVVLPFVNLTASPEDEYFVDGLTEELTNSVAHLDGLRVIARTTAFQFKGKASDIRSIAKQLHVNAVLEGSVQRQEGKLRVTVQLNDGQSGYHIWSQTYDRDAVDLFSIEEDISNQVARTIRPKGPATAAAPTRDRDAYNLYLLGRFHRSRPDQASIRKAMGFFEQAMDKDAKYAAAYAGLAECYMKLALGNYMPAVDAWPAAQRALDKALQLDDNLSEAHTTQATVFLLMDRNWAAAEAQFRRALALNGNDAAAHHWFSHYFTVMGRVSESLAESRKALELSPLDIQINSHLISNYVRARDFPNAIKAGLATLDLDPHSQLAYLFLMWAYEDTGQWEKAIDASQLATRAHPAASIMKAAFEAEGSRGYWRVNEEFLSKQANPENLRMAVCYARLGQRDQALVRLKQAFEKREPESIYVKSEPAFDWLQGDPRFRELTLALKLP